MTRKKSRCTMFVCKVLVLGISTSTTNAAAQTPAEAASELVRSLAWNPCVPQRDSAGLVSICPVVGTSKAEPSPVKELQKRGPEAAAAIESALDSIDAEGPRSEYALNLYWLLLAYVTVRGPAVLPRLSKLTADPNGEQYFGLAVFDATAFALDLTSWVPDTRLPVARIGFQQPRDALDQLIDGWERNDPEWLRAGLGPESNTALANLLDGRDWTELRSELRSHTSVGHVAVGYRFEAPRDWSVPRMAIEEELSGSKGPRQSPDADPKLSSARPTLETHFTSRSGRDCGSRPITFLRDSHLVGPGGDPYPKFLVNDPDLAGLLRLIAGCAAAE